MDVIPRHHGCMRPRRVLAGNAVTLATVLLSTIFASGQTPPSDLVVTPATSGGRPSAFHASVNDLKGRGFVEQEFFIAGTVQPPPSTTGPTQNYKTRVLVRRPVERSRFNGTVVVEWLNVALGHDLELGWPMFGEMIMRDGYAWVGISAQAGRNRVSEEVGSTALWNAAASGWAWCHASRAGRSTVAPGEAVSDAIFTEIADALRPPGAVDALGGLRRNGCWRSDRPARRSVSSRISTISPPVRGPTTAISFTRRQAGASFGRTSTSRSST